MTPMATHWKGANHLFQLQHVASNMNTNCCVLISLSSFAIDPKGISTHQHIPLQQVASSMSSFNLPSLAWLAIDPEGV